MISPPGDTMHMLSASYIFSGAKGARLFTHSYLGLGFDAALQKAADLIKIKAASLKSGEVTDGSALVSDPCLPIGYASLDLLGIILLTSSWASYSWRHALN